MPGGSNILQRNRLCSVLFLVCVHSECILSTSGATEQLSIQTLLAQAASYELQIVTLRGVIKDMQAKPPILLKRNRPYAPCLLYGQATFVLEDDTGSLPVEVFGNCRPEAAASLPNDGDQVVLKAVIQISKGEMPMRVWAQATEIRLVPDAMK
jgi:hypothetical protein